MHVSYRRAIAWIAHNDEPLDRNPDNVYGQASVQLVADLFRKHPIDVAQGVVDFRVEHKIGQPDSQCGCSEFRNMNGGCDVCGEPCL